MATGYERKGFNWDDIFNDPQITNTDRGLVSPVTQLLERIRTSNISPEAEHCFAQMEEVLLGLPAKERFAALSSLGRFMINRAGQEILYNDMLHHLKGEE
jgi:hypothetical protein